VAAHYEPRQRLSATTCVASCDYFECCLGRARWGCASARAPARPRQV